MVENSRSGSSPIIQPKLKVSQAGDAYEQEADRVAEQVMRMSWDNSITAAMSKYEERIDHKWSRHEMKKEKQRENNKINIGRKPSGDASFESPIGVADEIEHIHSSVGTPLDAETQEFMESRFDYDFSNVRIHTDGRASKSAKTMDALAYTIGNDIVFGLEQYSPGTVQGKYLIAHELAHVVQQLGHVVQRQEIPMELKQNVNLDFLTEPELRARYDLIAETLSQFNQSTDETMILQEEAGKIAAELTERALMAGRTFSPEAIEQMKAFFIANAKSSRPKDCIATLNKGMRIVINNPAQPVKSEIQTTMAEFQSSGVASEPRIIELRDATGKITKGVREPATLEKSVWETVIEMSGRDFGWSVFGLSIMDGYHSVTLTLDNNDPSNPRIYWSDQWSDKGGWKEYDKGGLDKEITDLTIKWWKSKPDDRKPKTRSTLWRIRRPQLNQP